MFYVVYYIHLHLNICSHLQLYIFNSSIIFSELFGETGKGNGIYILASKFYPEKCKFIPHEINERYLYEQKVTLSFNIFTNIVCQQTPLSIVVEIFYMGDKKEYEGSLLWASSRENILQICD